MLTRCDLEKCRRGNLTRILEMESTDKEISELKPSEDYFGGFCGGEDGKDVV